MHSIQSYVHLKIIHLEIHNMCTEILYRYIICNVHVYIMNLKTVYLEMFQNLVMHLKMYIEYISEKRVLRCFPSQDAILNDTP